MNLLSYVASKDIAAIMPKKILFVTLAMNQTQFFHAVGETLRQDGYTVGYLCFHEPSWEYLQAKGASAYNMFDRTYGDGAHIHIGDFGISNVSLMLSHEQAAFEIGNSEPLLKKLRSYLAAADTIMRDWAGHDPKELVVIQELGGFLSNVATFHAARSLAVDNLFMEPSFFRGRFFFVCNSFAAPVITDRGGAEHGDTKEKVRKYLDEAIAKQSIVIPTKDAHHYRRPFQKLVDFRNWRRLFQKMAQKFIYGKREEFGHVFGHVWRHVRMVVNSQLLKLHYRDLPVNERFIYYPLHVPADVALTLRSPEYLDQCSLIDFIARSAHYPLKVVIKEHPALVGALGYHRLKRLLGQRDNVILAKPETNNYAIVRQADAVITINSKSGAEALLIGKPVIVLGDAFYRSCRLVHEVDRLRDLPQIIAETISTPRSVDMGAVRAYFEDIWTQSYPGELYDTSLHNIIDVTNSMKSYLSGNARYNPTGVVKTTYPTATQ